MVKLFLNVTIDEFIANTDSIIEIYLNNHFIGCLGSNIRNINRSVVIASNDSTIVIKRKYMKPEFSKKARLIKITLSSVISLALMAGSIIKPFECPYECEETIKISTEEDLLRINVACFQHEGDQCPNFHIDSQNCFLHIEKNMFISREELKDIYSERKRLIYVLFLTFTVLLAFVLFLSAMHNNLTTIVFLLVIFALVLLCTIYSLKNLKKEYLKIRQNTGDG